MTQYASAASATRPYGAACGFELTKTTAEGGLDFVTKGTSLFLLLLLWGLMPLKSEKNKKRNFLT